MFGLGTLINTGCIVAGGLAGMLCGRFIKDNHRETLGNACGVSVIFIGIAGAMEGMLSVNDGRLTAVHTMLLVLSVTLGALIGELICIEKHFSVFGDWLKRKTGNSGDGSFTGAFVSASLTVCIGAMAVVGSVKDGIGGDWSVLALKGILDFVIVAVMTGSLGRGCIFSAIPVFLFEGAMTLLSHFIAPYMTDTAVAYVSFVGSVLIFCVGLNLIRDKKIRVANFLPAVILAAAAAYVPVSF